MRTQRALPQVLHSYFPGAYFVFRNLSLRVRDDGVSGDPIPFGLMMRLVPMFAAQLQARSADDPAWARFAGVSADRLELIRPSLVQADVEPTTWWCTGCGELLTGALDRLGVRNAQCPQCSARRLVQLNAVFVCSNCHQIRSARKPLCQDCGDSSAVRLRGGSGRRREYHFVCGVHAAFRRDLMEFCERDRIPMRLKATGGRVHLPALLRDISTTTSTRGAVQARGSLTVLPARADVVEAIVGRIPVADVGAYYRRREFSIVEPFTNAHTGGFKAFVHRLETDALTIRIGGDIPPVATHSLKHALLNAAPAVTGLTQEEFGATWDGDTREITIYDNVQGGSGGSDLLGNRRLDRWLGVAKELAECHQVQCDDACRGCLFLPSRLCRAGNLDLDRHQVLTLLST